MQRTPTLRPGPRPDAADGAQPHAAPGPQRGAPGPRARAGRRRAPAGPPTSAAGAAPGSGRERLLPWIALLVNLGFGLTTLLRWLGRAAVLLLDALAVGAARGARAAITAARAAPPRVEAALSAAESAAPQVEDRLRRAGRGVLALLDGLAAVAGWAGRMAWRGLRAADRELEPVHAAAGRAAARAGSRLLDALDRLLTIRVPVWVRLSRPRAGRLLRGAARSGPRLGLVTVAAVFGLGWLTGATLAAAHALADRVAEQLAAAPDRALPPLAERSVVRAADGTTLATLHGEVDRRLVELEEIPAHTRAAVIAAEDRDFFTHDGFDAQGMARAAWANLRAGTIVQGGSTLTQQLAKQNHAGPARTFERKAREIVYAMALEQLFTKEQLLERYLNEVYFGSGAYGVATAAEEFFGVDVADLTVGESALLAGLVRSPNALDPRANPADALRVRDQVLSAMVSDGAVDARTREAARAAPLAVAPPVAPEVVDPFVVEALKREVLADPAFGATREDRVRALFAGGLEITLTVDPALQEAARQAVASHAEGTEATRAAVVATDPRTGAVRALYSGGDFGDSQFDLATQGRRQPGSAFKPFVAAAALEAGWTGEELLIGAASATFPDPSGSTWTVTNFAGASYEDMDLGDALAASVNTAFGQLVTEVGVEAVTDVLGRVGIDVDAALGPPRRRGPAIALGGIDQGVSPLEMASAYGTFANGGQHVRPTLIERAVSTDGEVVRALDPQPQQALDPAVNARMVELLRDVVAEGTGTAAQLPGQRPIGKTGTSQASADAWFVGATDELSAAVWMGDPTRRSPLPGVTGGDTAAPVWQAFMTAALAEQP